MTRRHRPFLLLLAAAAASPPALPAQRETPTLEWQKRSTTIAYGAVPVGRHSLAELPIGGSWRLGMNEASTWNVEMPILLGGRVLPPGQYRVTLVRDTETGCALVADGSAHALGGGDDLSVPGELRKAKKPGKKLALQWAKAAAAAKAPKDQLPATLTAEFGDDVWSGELVLFGGRSQKVGRWQLTVFALPAEVVAGREQARVPVAVLSRGKGKELESWNLLLSGHDARLVPWMRAPTEQFGFGEVEPPDAELVTTGDVESAPAAVEVPVPALELRGAAPDKDGLAIELAVGKETIRVTVPEPGARKR